MNWVQILALVLIEIILYKVLSMKIIKIWNELEVQVSDEDWAFMCEVRFFSENPTDDAIETEFVNGTRITPKKR